jgi:hypothetical protein
MKTFSQRSYALLIIIFMFMFIISATHASSSYQASQKDNPGSPSLTPGSNVPFVELIYFSVRKVNESVQLSWRTASETNNEFFIPEKSTDNKNFITVGTVKGADKSLIVNDYIYEDRNYENQITYYRLKFYGTEGECSYSGVITLNNNSSAVSKDPKLLDHPDD